MSGYTLVCDLYVAAPPDRVHAAWGVVQGDLSHDGSVSLFFTILDPQNEYSDPRTPDKSALRVDLQHQLFSATPVFSWWRHCHLCIENFTSLLVRFVQHFEGQVKGTVDAVTFCRSLQCANVGLQSFGEARGFRILKPEV